MSQRFYEFGPYCLDTGRCLLERDGASVPLTSKTFDILLTLIEGHGEIVSKDELMRRVWPDSFVEEGNLTYNVSVLRKALGEREEAFAALERAYAAHDLQLQFLRIDSNLDPLRADPRFQDLLRRVGLAQKD